MLQTVSPEHSVPLIVVASAIPVVAALAALTPARRVMAIDPVSTLRGD
jgi:ABC-type lipoprotein release transport system permease subunit